MEDLTAIPTTFRLDPTIVAGLKETAAREDRTQIAVVERALRAYIAASKAAEQTPEPAPAVTAG